MTIKLVGCDDGMIDGQSSSDYFCLYKYTAVASGSCSEVKIKVSGICTVKVAVYADNSGEPGTRLAKQDTAASCAAGWNTIALEANCDIVSGTNYWLAFNSSAVQVGYDIASGVLRYKAAVYSTFAYPNPAGSGFAATTSYNGFIAAWGLDAALKTSSDTGSAVETVAGRSQQSGEQGSSVEVSVVTVSVTGGDAGVGSEISGTEASGPSDSVYGADAGKAADALRSLVRQSGTDFKLSGNAGQLGLPHKEVCL